MRFRVRVRVSVGVTAKEVPGSCMESGRDLLETLKKIDHEVYAQDSLQSIRAVSVVHVPFPGSWSLAASMKEFT